VNRKYYEENREKVLEQVKRYMKANKERIAEYKKKYRKENKERIVEYKKKYRMENKEFIVESNKKYREANKENIEQKSKRFYEEIYEESEQLLVRDTVPHKVFHFLNNNPDVELKGVKLAFYGFNTNYIGALYYKWVNITYEKYVMKVERGT